MEQRRILFAIAVGLSLLTTLTQAAPHRDRQQNLPDNDQAVAVLDSDPDQIGQPPEQNFALPDMLDQDSSNDVKPVAHRPLRTDTNDPVVKMVDFSRG